MKSEVLENTRVKYQVALDLFASEGQIQWNRYNVMLVTNTIFFGLITFDKYSNLPSFQILFSFSPIFGFIFCYLWHRMTKRGFIWMKHWISEARKLEKELEGRVNPIQDGNEFRLKIGTDVTRNASLLIIKIIAFLYFFMVIINISPWVIQIIKE